MHVTSLDHVNIRSQDLASSAAFYVEVLGLKSVLKRTGSSEAYWLLDKYEHAIIHLRGYDTPPGDTGPFDHFALRCVGKGEVIERLTARGVPFQLFEREPGQSVLLTQDPHGVRLELNFYGE
jgi:catechol 2,3-dioxygenase-like lactoylglutathione lyase family enzyme